MAKNTGLELAFDRCSLLILASLSVYEIPLPLTQKRPVRKKRKGSHSCHGGEDPNEEVVRTPTEET